MVHYSTVWDITEFNPFIPNGFFYLHSLDQSSPTYGVSGWFLLLPYFIEIPVLNANSVDPDQMPRSLVSDLGLNCLLMSLLWDARHKWVKDVPKQKCIDYIEK